MKKLRTLFSRRDFQTNPIKALVKRLVWRIRWLVYKSPWTLRLANGMEITVPNVGLGALIYYMGFSEPETAEFFQKYLKPGMTFFDIGAFLGEYTLIASKMVSPSGEVHTFEPNPGMIPYIQNNITQNKITNNNLCQFAVAETKGVVSFNVRKQPSQSSISITNQQNTDRASSKIVVPTISLNEYTETLQKLPNVIKMDVEGAELFVFKGSTKLLELPAELAPIWVFECNARNYGNFNYKPKDILGFLQSYGYKIFCFDNHVNRAIALKEIDQDFQLLVDQNLVASKTALR